MEYMDIDDYIDCIKNHDMFINMDTFELYIKGKLIDLQNNWNLFDFICILAENNGKIVKYENLLKHNFQKYETDSKYKNLVQSYAELYYKKLLDILCSAQEIEQNKIEISQLIKKIDLGYMLSLQEVDLFPFNHRKISPIEITELNSSEGTKAEEKTKSNNSHKKLKLKDEGEKICINCDGYEETVKLSKKQGKIFKVIINRRGFVDILINEVSSKQGSIAGSKAKKDTVYSTVNVINTKINAAFGFKPIIKENNGPYILSCEID